MAKASERATKLYFQCAREQMAPYHIVMHTFSIGVEDSQALATFRRKSDMGTWPVPLAFRTENCVTAQS